MKTSKPVSAETVVIGVGNPLMGDDGVGLAALELLRDGWEFEPHVELVDGGTWGMNLLPVVEGARRVLLLDAIDVGEAPGAQVVLERNALPRYLGTKVSPHQIDLRDVLALAQLRETLPEATVAIGVQPGRLEMMTALSPRVHDGLDGMIERAVQRLASWGHQPRQRVRERHA